MKMICFSFSTFCLFSNTKILAQNVGVGTTTPSEKLEVIGNVKAGAFKYTSPKTSYYSVNESAFRARNTAETVISGVGKGGAYITNGANYGLSAPVNLPQNAIITQFTVQFYDASLTQDLSAYLVNEFSSGYSFLANVSSSGSSGLNIQNYILPAPVIVDNSSSSYELLVIPLGGSWNTSDIQVRSVIIQCTISETN